MKSGVQSLLVLLVALLLLLTYTSALPSWQCRVCEDVVQTWHDHFQCAGNFLNWGDPTIMDIRGCQGPEFDCNRLTGQLKAACFSMMQQFASETLIQRKIWEIMMLKNKPYDVCIAIGKCPDEALLTTPSPCHQAFMDPYCKHNWQCKQFTEKCSESCYLCNWLVRDFPLFQESCKPTGASLPLSVPLPTDKWSGLGGAFLETSRAKTHWDRARRLRTAQRARFMSSASKKISLGVTDSPKIQLMTGSSKTSECFKVWNLIKTSAKARYFVSWKRYVNVMPNNVDRLKGEMWDANVVCKCLGRCETSRFEDLGLIEACRFDETDHRMMDYIFRASGEVGVV